jgi:hypothetical protein
MGQLIPISEWASGPKGFKYPPKKTTLHKYAATDQIYPKPKRQGKKWVVDEDAVFVGILAPTPDMDRLPKPVSDLVKRALNGG